MFSVSPASVGMIMAILGLNSLLHQLEIFCYKYKGTIKLCADPLFPSRCTRDKLMFPNVRRSGNMAQIYHSINLKWKYLFTSTICMEILCQDFIHLMQRFLRKAQNYRYLYQISTSAYSPLKSNYLHSGQWNREIFYSQYMMQSITPALPTCHMSLVFQLETVMVSIALSMDLV